MTSQPLDYRGPTQPPLCCAACGSDLTVEGTLAGHVGFKPHKIRKFFSVTGMLDVAATACSACGALTFRVDRTALVDLAGEPPSPDSPKT